MRVTDIKAISRKEFVRKFRALGFEGPKRTGAHLFMRRGSVYIRIPEVEKLEVSAGLQWVLLRQLEIDMPVWDMA